ncbi:hypothetical protein [Leptospira santarosai]|uniref:hypothetical protein n=1 Tax=Leptospira santarosai TaxID=28183 RepID=UPI000307C621|nr:hypothetical protein [Leptospira santarosai]
MSASILNQNISPTPKEKKSGPLKDSDTFFFREENGEILYMDRRDAIRVLEVIRNSKNQTYNDAA